MLTNTPSSLNGGAEDESFRLSTTNKLAMSFTIGGDASTKVKPNPASTPTPTATKEGASLGDWSINDPTDVPLVAISEEQKDPKPEQQPPLYEGVTNDSNSEASTVHEEHNKGLDVGGNSQSNTKSANEPPQSVTEPAPQQEEIAVFSFKLDDKVEQTDLPVDESSTASATPDHRNSRIMGADDAKAPEQETTTTTAKEETTVSTPKEEHMDTTDALPTITAKEPSVASSLGNDDDGGGEPPVGGSCERQPVDEPAALFGPPALSIDGILHDQSMEAGDSMQISGSRTLDHGDASMMSISNKRHHSDTTPFTSLRELEGILEAAWGTPPSVLDAYVYHYAHEGAKSERVLPYRTKSMVSHRSSISAFLMDEESAAAKRRRASPFVRYEHEEADRAALRLKFHAETTTHAPVSLSPRPSSASSITYHPPSSVSSTATKRQYTMPHHPLVRHYLQSAAAGAPYFPPSFARDAKAFLQETNFLCRAEDQARQRLQRVMFGILKDWIPHRNTLKELYDRDKRETQRLVLREVKTRNYVEEEQDADRGHIRFLSNFDLRKSALSKRGLSVQDGELMEEIEEEEGVGRKALRDRWLRELDRMQDTMDRDLFTTLQSHERGSGAVSSGPTSLRQSTVRSTQHVVPLSPNDLLATRSPSQGGGNGNLSVTLFDETALLSSHPNAAAILEQTSTLYGLTQHQSPKAVIAERKVRAGVMNRVSLRELSKARRDDTAEVHSIGANQVRSESAFLSHRHEDSKQRELKRNFAHVVKQRDNRKKTRKEFQAAQEDLHAQKRAEARQDYLAYKWEWHDKQHGGEEGEKVSQLCDKQRWKANVLAVQQRAFNNQTIDTSAIEADNLSAMSEGMEPFRTNRAFDDDIIPLGRKSLAPIPDRQGSGKKPPVASGNTPTDRRLSTERPSTVPTKHFGEGLLTSSSPHRASTISVHSGASMEEATRPPTRAARSTSSAPPPSATKARPSTGLLPMAQHWQARKAMEMYQGRPDLRTGLSSSKEAPSRTNATSNVRASSANNTSRPPKPTQTKSGAAHPIDTQMAKTALSLSTLIRSAAGDDNGDKRGVQVVDFVSAVEQAQQQMPPQCAASLKRAVDSCKIVRKGNQLLEVDQSTAGVAFDYEAHIAHLLATCDPFSDSGTYSHMELLACRLLKAQEAIQSSNNSLGHRLYLLALKTATQLNVSETQLIRTKNYGALPVHNVKQCQHRLELLQRKIGGALSRASGQLQEALRELQAGIDLENNPPPPSADEQPVPARGNTPLASSRGVGSGGGASARGRVGQLDTEALSHSSMSRPGTAGNYAGTPISSSPIKGSFGTASRDIQPKLVDQYGQLTRLGAVEEQRKKVQVVKDLKKAASTTNGTDTPRAVWLAEGGEVASTTDYAISMGNPVLRLNIAAVLTQSGQCAAAVKVGREAVGIITAQLQANIATVMDAAKSADAAGVTKAAVITTLPFPNALEVAVAALLAIGSAQGGLPALTASGAPSERDSATTTAMIVSDLSKECLPVGHPLRDRGD